MSRIEEAAHILGVKVRVSRRNARHVVFQYAGVTYSLIYFHKTKIWRLFWPYTATAQQHQDYDSFDECVASIYGN